MKLYIGVLLFLAFLVKPFGVDAQSFQIIDPGPQPANTNFILQLTNARDASNNLRSGDFLVEIVTVSPSPDTRTLKYSDITFSGGNASVLIKIPSEGVWTTKVIIAEHTGSQQFIILTTDLSTFTLGNPGTQTAGTPFSLGITGAKNYYNQNLTGDCLVTVATDNTSEGSSGQLFSGNVTFTAGVATISSAGIVLYEAIPQTLTVEVVDSITSPETGGVTVNAAAASKLVITQQPGNVIGTYNDSPVTLSTVNLETQDAYDNPSTSGFSGVQNVTLSLANNPGGAALAGTTVVDIQSGTASFSAVTIDEEGTGYTLSFASASPISLTSVTSDAFNVTQLYNQSDFTIASPSDASTQYQNVDFQMSLTGAKTNTGDPLTGAQNVTITSSSEGIVFNNDVTFTAGAASLTLALGNLGAHTLTVAVEGVDTNETLGLTVDADASTFTLSNPASPQYDGVSFNLNITGAKNYGNALIDEEAVITVVSSMSGVVYSSSTLFNDGNATLSIALDSIATHNLTVTIAGITGSKVTNDFIVYGDDSDFTVDISSTDEQTAGLNSDINLTGALATNNSPLNGLYNVNIVSSDTTEGANGLVFNHTVRFVGGVADTTINLKVAVEHTLTISVAGVTNPKTHIINVIAAAASKLAIMQPPVGASGSWDNSAVNIGTVIVQTQDEFGNLSTSGLGSPQDITVSLTSNTVGATFGGTKTINVSVTGTATFSTLTLNKNGTFALSISSPAFDAVTSIEFTMTNVQNLSGFEIVAPGPQIINVPFNLQIINARDAQGNLLNTTKNVFVKRLLPDPDSIVVPSTGFSFTGGAALIPITLGRTGTHEFEVIVDITIQNSFSLVVVTDASDMVLALDPIGNQTAGTQFDLDITGAKDASGADLIGSHAVTITSSNTSEGLGGVLFDGPLEFAGGITTTPLTLIRSSLSAQVLTVDIDWVKTPETINVTVNPNTATQFLVTQQPLVAVNGSNNNAALSIGTVILQTQDAHGNISTVGLTGTTTVSVGITSNPAGANLGGTTTAQDISTNGTVSFGPLSLDKNGVYTLSFTYNGTTPTFTPNPAVTNTITMTNVENLSGFTLTPEPGDKYAEYPFDLSITNAQTPDGTGLSGAVGVTITSDLSGSIYSGSPVFSGGSVTIPLTMAAGTHDLTVSITGITNPETIIDLLILPDLSDMVLSLVPALPTGPYYNYEPFTLAITAAKGLNGENLGTSQHVTVTSNQADGIVYDGPATFTGGSVELPIILTTIATHSLTVDIDTVTIPETLTDIIVQDNTSGFDIALAVVEDKTAGVAFGLNVTNATSLSNYSMTGSYNVTVTSSNLSEGPLGVVFNQAVTFTTGSASFDITLETAELQQLIVDIDSITPNETLDVNIIAAAVSKLVLAPQPAGGTGTQDDAATSIGSVTLSSYDQFDNPSIIGLGGDMNITVELSNDASDQSNAILGGTLTQSISDGTATFDNLTLDQDGAGYTLTFSYVGTPAFDPIISSPFNMIDVNEYSISITDALDNILSDIGPFVFDTVTVAYPDITAEVITITREAGGVVKNLTVGLSGTNPGSFAITQPADLTLNNLTNSTTFTLKPNHGLSPGNYSAILTVTADSGINETFNVMFRVLAASEISLNAANPTTFAQVTEGYAQVTDATVTISNIGGGTITGLSVAISGTLGTSDTSFVAGIPVATEIAPGANTTFTIRPDNSLPVGDYTATVTINNDQSVPQSFDVSFTVIAYTYAISLTAPGNVDFGLVAEGYNPAPAAVTKTITRTGTGPIDNIVISISGGGSSNFEISQPDPDSIFMVPDNTTFTVQPKTGLLTGSYTETVTVSAANMTAVTFTVTLTVSGNLTWDGSVSSDWHTADNWTPASVPSQLSFITIPNIGNDPVISSVNVTVNNLTIQSGALLTVTSARRLTVAADGLLTVKPGGMLTCEGTLVNNAGASGLVVESDPTGTGSIIQSSSGVPGSVQRYMTGGPATTDPAHIISSPVSGVSIGGFFPSEVAAMRYHTESTGLWMHCTSNNPGGNFVAGRGYAARNESSSAITFAGSLNVAPVSITIDSTRFGWNSVGNPFSSSLDVQTFLTTNLDLFVPINANCYVYTKNGNPLYQPIGNGESLQPGQGFFVSAQTSGSLDFTSQMQIHENKTFFKKSTRVPIPKFTLSVKDSKDSTFTTLAFKTGMTKGLDVTWDAGLCYDGSRTDFRLYSKLIEGNIQGEFNIQYLPDDEPLNMIVPIGFEFQAGGLVTFSSTISPMPTGYTPILEDRELGIFTRMDSPGSKYEVALPSGTSGVERFFLHTVLDATSANQINKENINIFAVKKEIYIKGIVSEGTLASVYDLMGRKVADYQMVSTGMNIFNTNNYKVGFYIVKVANKEFVQTKKIFISE